MRIEEQDDDKPGYCTEKLRADILKEQPLRVSYGANDTSVDEVGSPIEGTGLYQVGNDLKGNGRITRIERSDPHTCTITLDNQAKLKFHNDHIVNVERSDGSSYKMTHLENGALKEIIMPSGEKFERHGEEFLSQNGRQKFFEVNRFGSVYESASKDADVATIHYPDETSVTGHVIRFQDKIRPVITKVEHKGKVLAECNYNNEGFLSDIQLHSGESWTLTGPMQWKSNAGGAWNGSFYFEEGRHLCRKDVEGERDHLFKPF